MGYCDYYGSAMVVLARSAGLPARIVVGYASGEYDASTVQYFIRMMDARTWAEIYFPEIGWVEFEPTASQPLILRLGAEADSKLGLSQVSGNSVFNWLKM